MYIYEVYLRSIGERRFCEVSFWVKIIQGSAGVDTRHPQLRMLVEGMTTFEGHPKKV